MKILIHSNSPTAPTGYGVQTGLLALRLRDAGHEVAISTNSGQTHPGRWPAGDPNGILVYTSGREAGGNDVILRHANHFFQGDPTAGWIITLIDVFALQHPGLRDWQIAAWTPIDHDPAPPGVIDFFRRTGARPIAMSKFGQHQLRQFGLDPLYVPLAIDPTVYKPTPTVGNGTTTTTGRQLMSAGGEPIDDTKFVVMMNFMNKGLQVYDRKGAQHAFFAFGEFARTHPDAVLFVNSDELDWGLGGFNLPELARAASIQEHQIRYVDQYAYQLMGWPAELLAACYTAADVFLAPSMGEGFCVPLIEAQACGTPVIVTDFSAQPELVGAGWKVAGQAAWNEPQKSRVVTPFQFDIIAKLNEAYDKKHNDPAGWKDLSEKAVYFASRFDADRVFSEQWAPVLASLEYQPEPLELDRPVMGGVDVIIPVKGRPHVARKLVEAYEAANDGTAILHLVVEPGDRDAYRDALDGCDVDLIDAGDRVSFAEKVNLAVRRTTRPWVFLAGDDTIPQPGWIEAARRLSDRYDVIGTNDGGLNNLVAAGVHADHMFIRRSYIDTYGASLDGPGVCCHEGYRHFYVDVELIELAKQRGVFSPCLESVVEHHRLREPDDVDLLAMDGYEVDKKVWGRRQAAMSA